MGVMNKLRRLLGLVEGHEDTVAKQVSKRTSVGEETVKDGLDRARDAVDTESSDDTHDRSRR